MNEKIAVRILITALIQTPLTYADPCAPENPKEPKASIIQETQKTVNAVTAPILRPSHEEFMEAVKRICGSYTQQLEKMRKAYAAKPRDLKPFKDDGGEGTDELLSIFMYTDSCYETINSITEQGLTLPIEAYLQMAKIALGRLPPYRGQVMRGSNLPGIEKAHQPGKLIQYRNFISTSKSNAFLGKDYQLLIHSETGRFVGPYASFPKEREVLFPPGTVFKVQDRIHPDGSSLPAEREKSQKMKLNKWNPVPSNPDIDVIVLREVQNYQETPELLPPLPGRAK